ncbi:MAG: DUF1624 domain-containing protein [Betaproteobacteria bacterium]|nr:DUF1624 domain-containing protein [Betaproteobacteria bacterium]
MASASNTDRQTQARIPLIDELRGVAITMMVIFHFCYDLTYFHYAHFNMLENPFWVHWRTVIVAFFVVISGISFGLAPDGSSHFIRRVSKLFFSAAIISIVTYFLFGDRFIYFGVIHFFLIATLVTKPFKQFKKPLLIIGFLMVALSFVYHFEFMNPKYLNWIGLASTKPATEDYAPLFPWLGYFLISLSLAALIKPNILKFKLNVKVLSFMGRHSLLIYLIHQPILFIFILTYKSLITV